MTKDEIKWIKTKVDILRDKMEAMRDDERIDLMNDLMEGYCTLCGTSHTPCHCAPSYDI